MKKPRFLTLDVVLHIHQFSLRQYGGSDGMRDRGALESAVMQPQSGFDDQYFHEDLAAMAGAYLFHIVKNHPFVDGNKRTGTLAAITFLDVNGFEISADERTFEEQVLRVASSRMTKQELSAFIRSHLTLIEPASHDTPG